MDIKYDHLESQKVSEIWEKENLYKFDPNSKKPVFSIDTPPPTVSGSLHIGHIFSYTHTDIIARYKRMSGYNIFYPMGFDDNGLATERFVEKKHQTKAHLMKRAEFIKLCLEESGIVEKEFENLWKQMGLSIDWSKTYSTISKKARRISQYSFIDLYNKGLITRKEEPSLYCTTCRTSVAQAELDSSEISTTFNDIEFSTENSEKLVIATTRPELLPACVAVFFNPTDSRYKHLENKFAITPIFNKKVKIIADELVDKEKGSGLVMCCTFGDQTDILWYKKYKLPFIQTVDFEGKWIQEPLTGLRLHEARKKILELLDSKLLSQKKITHAVNVHERCKQEIEYLILKQWFIKILEHKEAFLKRADEIEWKPEFMKARYKDWVENLNWDWCISRQRYSGIPFPVWHCQSCKEVIIADKKDLPIDPQESSSPKCRCGSNNVVPDTDVMDTWATSSLTPQININWPDNNDLPMSMRPQSHDIIRTWAFYTIVKAHYHNNTIPWKNIIISGHVMSGKEKISKSQGGATLTPELLIKQYPIDVIRYWTAQIRLGTDTVYSENQFKIGQRLLTKLWNAIRFCNEHIKQYEKKSEPKLDDLSKWLLHEFSQTIISYRQLFEKYEYTHALENVEKFFWNNFCDNYLELIKDQIFNPDKYSEEIREATLFTMYEVCFGLLQLFAPFIPYITETLYLKLFKDKEHCNSIHATILDEKRFLHSDQESANLINNVIEIISKVRKLKTENQLSLKTELSILRLYSSDNKKLKNIKSQEKIISGITHTQKIEYIAEKFLKCEIKSENETWCANIII